jgi:tRNA threonylcarbamoyladenosine biosynthesis protein TsaE
MPNFTIQKVEELHLIAKELLYYIHDNPVLAFYGKMGIGKTTLIKALCKEMFVENTVTSPTFALVNEYTTSSNETIYHFDFYRINKVEELFDLGYEEYFYSGKYCFVEWPELAENMLPDNTLKITLTEDSKGSRVISWNDSI